MLIRYLRVITAHAYWTEITADAYGQLISNNYSWSYATHE